MLVKAMNILNLVTGIITVVSAITFAICVKINNEMAILVCGVLLLLIGGMYIATSILKVIGEYFTKN